MVHQRRGGREGHRGQLIIATNLNRYQKNSMLREFFNKHGKLSSFLLDGIGAVVES